MPQSLVKNYVHITFSTKHRAPLIFQSLEGELHNYLAKICIDHECHSVKIGGFDDHVHIVCSLSRKISLASLIEHLKTSSSKWMKTKDSKLRDFYWQGGYYAVSVNPANLDRLIDYVKNQRAHHSTRHYKQEVIALLLENDIPYDERYVWD